MWDSSAAGKDHPNSTAVSRPDLDIVQMARAPMNSKLFSKVQHTNTQLPRADSLFFIYYQKLESIQSSGLAVMVISIRLWSSWNKLLLETAFLNTSLEVQLLSPALKLPKNCLF